MGKGYKYYTSIGRFTPIELINFRHYSVVSQSKAMDIRSLHEIKTLIDNRVNERTKAIDNSLFAIINKHKEL